MFLHFVVNYLHTLGCTTFKMLFCSIQLRYANLVIFMSFCILFQEIRNAFRQMNWLFTVSVSGKGTILDQGYNLTAIANEIGELYFVYDGLSQLSNYSI